MTTAGKKSRNALIDAAGRLFTRQGIDRVKLGDIAREAGVDACMIHYHFGGKDGLILAVLEQALARYEANDMRKYYAENRELLSSREGQSVFITGLVDTVFATFGLDGDERPGKSMLLQLLQYPNPLRQQLVEKHFRPLANVFFEIYRAVTGSADFESSFCWFMFLICPQYLHTACPGMIDLFHPAGRVSASFDRRLKLLTTNILLAGLGLA